ncbi:MAG: c-type cytochrome [Chloroflexi bacterium]|nr:c-type cytochrome [Chloroflexota bacterium]
MHAPQACHTYQELYEHHCSECHGVNREGVSGLGPALTADNLKGKSEEVLQGIISNGIQDTAMQGHADDMTSQQIDKLIKFIKNTVP